MYPEVCQLHPVHPPPGVLTLVTFLAFLLVSVYTDTSKCNDSVLFPLLNFTKEVNLIFFSNILEIYSHREQSASVLL